MEYSRLGGIFSEKKSTRPLFMECSAKKNPYRCFLPIFLTEKMEIAAIWISFSILFSSNCRQLPQGIEGENNGFKRKITPHKVEDILPVAY